MCSDNTQLKKASVAWKAVTELLPSSEPWQVTGLGFTGEAWLLSCVWVPVAVCVLPAALLTDGTAALCAVLALPCPVPFWFPAPAPC